MRKTRIALVSFDVNEGRGGLYPPLNLCVLATGLEQADYEVRVFDYSAPFSGLDAYCQEIRDYGPTLVGMACFTPYVALLHRISTRLRKAIPDAAFVIGGYHTTVLPEWPFEHMPQFDYAMQGESDHAIVQLAEMIDGQRGPETVAGLAYKSGDSIRKNECDRVQDLDALPVPRRDFLDRYYRAGLYSYVTSSGALDIMLTSRGCPFDCSFCFKVERRYRFRGVDSLMAEFEMLRSRGVRHVHIMDDAFTANKKLSHAIADALIQGKYNFRLKVRSRVNVVDEDLLRKLKACGVRQIVYGLESGSQTVLDCMNKGTTVDMNERAVRLTNKVGIFCTGDIMIGMPAETPDTLAETIAFLRRNRVIVGSVPYLYPLPGTKVYEDARANGTLQGDWTVDGHIPWVKLPWTESREDLARAGRQLASAVHRNPLRAMYLLWHNPSMLGPRNFRKRFREVARAIFTN